MSNRQRKSCVRALTQLAGRRGLQVFGTSNSSRAKMKNLTLEGKRLRSSLLSFAMSITLAIGTVTSLPALSRADENGISFWLPGLFGSLAAVPQQPGWGLTVMNYYDSVGASGAIAAARELSIGKLNPTVNINLNVNLSAKIDVGLINPSPENTGQDFLRVFPGRYCLAAQWRAAPLRASGKRSKVSESVQAWFAYTYV
jgi:hypothetical protein